VAFVAESREQVDERAAWLRERGAEIESDPDGIKLEIVHRPAR
jgi:biotin operon repressor